MKTRPDLRFGGMLRLAACIVLMAADPVLADDSGDDRAEAALTLKGFGTLGVARSDSDRTQFVRDLSQPNGLTRNWSTKVDSLVGLQAGLRLSEHTDGVLQAVSRYRYDGSYTPELTWAFLRRELSPEADLRFGRLGTEFYMLADSRLVGYANLTLRPPPDYYGPLVLSYFDGIDASRGYQIGDGLLRGKLFAGYAAEKSPFVGSLSWDMGGSLMAGGHLDYFVGPWQLRAGHAQVRFRHELPMNALVDFDVLSVAPELSVVGKWARFDSLGAVYDSGPLQLQGMLSRIRYDTAAYEDARAGYVIAAYRLAQVTPYFGYSRVASSPSSLSSSLTPAMHELVRQLTVQTHSDQHTVFVGGRWDFQPNVALKAQVDRIRSSPTSAFPFRNPVAGWNGRMTVFSLALDFIF